MRPETMLSREYQAVAELLNAQWTGTYGDLAVAIGRGRRSGRVIGRLVKSYALRHANWPHNRVYAKLTGQPAYM